MQNLKFLILNCSFAFLIFNFTLACFAQQSDDLEFTLDVTTATIPTPKIFRPNIDLSGRGLNRNTSWPQALAHEKVLEAWRGDIGFSGGLYRLQYNLWEIHALAKDKAAQEELLNNYDLVIRQISDSGGVIILDIFGTPAGLGRVLDKKTPPIDLRAYKELIKSYIRRLSCEKKYNIWYEVWSAPDLDDFFLGRVQDYLNLYRAVAESILELEVETKVHIPVGGPSTSWWFQNLDGNTILAPEQSLIYELIKFCAKYRLPLNFISWHGYSTSPNVEQEATKYKKAAAGLIRDWLSYFGFDQDTLLIVDEWNFDTGLSVSPQRNQNSYIASSYIPARLKNMYEAGLDNQIYFSLEDFFNQKEGVVRNVGAFCFDPEASEYKGQPKSIYNTLRLLNRLGSRFFKLKEKKINDEFVGSIATAGKEELSLLFYNYIDPDIFKNYLSRHIAALNNAERKVLLNLVKSGSIEKISNGAIDIAKLRTTKKLKSLLKKAKDLSSLADQFKDTARNIKVGLKNLKGKYLYQRYTIDASCSINCPFLPVEEKEIDSGDLYQEVLSLKPYSVSLVVLKNKPPEAEPLEGSPLSGEAPR